MKAMRLALSVVAGVLSLAVASPAAAAPPTIVDDTVTVTREDALAAYAADPTNVFQDCGDFVVLAAFTTERRRMITFEDRELVLVSFTGELFRPDTDVAVTYAGSARIEVGSHRRARDCYDDWTRAVPDRPGRKPDRLRCGCLQRRLQQRPTNVFRARPQAVRRGDLRRSRLIRQERSSTAPHRPRQATDAG